MEDNRLQVTVTEDELAAFIGDKAPKYLVKFRKFSVNGIDRFSATWHWPAFFVGFWWLLYRKMYLWALVYFILLFVPYANIAAWIALAVSGNYLYYRHARGEITRIKAFQSSGDILQILSELGGTNNWIPVIGIVVTAIVFLMMILGLILSAC
ncbi:MAG: DUF2628 domain-containing protein [Nitrospirota bacterium]